MVSRSAEVLVQTGLRRLCHDREYPRGPSVCEASAPSNPALNLPALARCRSTPVSLGRHGVDG